ncbi:MAG TPA: 1-acyl-sn-glycerol-3-phosphate acyltransferase [Pseudomonadales bacterium]
MTDNFDDIRPYRDDEVLPVLARILANSELMLAVTKLRFPRWPLMVRRLLVPVVRLVLRRQLANVKTVLDFQHVVAGHMEHMIETTTSAFTVSGIEHLQAGQAYLFISNHRDIALDPAFINYALFKQRGHTVRIAIGDNLLTKDYVSDLMRLNKSFIVKRSVSGMKELLKASKHLAAYMRFSIQQERHSVWIAQREGRAKNGIDRTEPAVIKMIALAQDRKEESLADFVSGMHIVPVSISYEFDPCDQMKAGELLAKARTGSYQKGEHEDVASIAQGIAGQKGAVHLAIGRPLSGSFDSIEAVVAALDEQIVGNYRLHASNYIAWQRLYGALPEGIRVDASEQQLDSARAYLDERLAGCEADAAPYLLGMYANCIKSLQEYSAGRSSAGT